MLQFVFEDDKKTPASILLKSCYNGKNLHFAGGGKASNVLRAIRECLASSSDPVMVFFDLPPNNEDTYANYEKLTEKIEEMKEERIVIIPVICMEYFILRFLIFQKYLHPVGKQVALAKYLVLSFDYQQEDVVEFVEKSSYRKASLEHVYKELLRILTAKSKCMLNQFQYNQEGQRIPESYHGKFYETDCDCDRRYCQINCRDSFMLKAERLYAELPGAEVITEEHQSYLESLGISMEQKELSELWDETEQFYEEVCESMSIAKPFLVRFL